MQQNHAFQEHEGDIHDLNSDFEQSPFIVIWEMTRSCALKCVHCRAEAVQERSPDELSNKEALTFLSETRRFGKPLMVLTGGDPMRRPEVFNIVRYGTNLGLRMAVTPSATGEMTCEKVRKLREAGLARLAVSLDGSTPEIHDAFRKVEGSYQWTLDIIRWANEVELPVQINTTITRHNIKDVDALCSLMESLKIVLWSVFFLVPVGRGKLEDEIRGSEYELVFNKMYDLSKKCSFDIKSTAAPHYRRVVLQRNKKANEPAQNLFGDGIGRSMQGVNDGKGFLFVSHTGEIYPSGFLPISAGNVRKDSLVDVYRNAPLFKGLRDTSGLKGKCGACEYKNLCGGSRARAWSVFGDCMQSDPFCVHVPKSYEITEEEKKFW